ncbi:MAG: potassium transporter Kup [Gammaproteobacteria bacterium]|nr:potassium transporter Kup [Gammaproteobacteria bacterium]
MSHAGTRGGLRQSVTLAALGVVFGDIGTSPLYALRQCFMQGHLAIDEPALLGVLSMMFWALVIVISLEYITFVLRADNDGEGGVLALMALVVTRIEKHRQWRGALTTLGLVGAALLFADAMITPAISVLSAVEGLQVQAPVLAPYVVPLTVVILSALYLSQRFGTGRIGAVFGPIIALWFTALGAIGLASIIETPAVLAALNPWYGLRLFLDHGVIAFLVMSAVFLVVTGGESLYADMGHFGRRPIRRAWFMIVLPGLVLNYFGQGALLLRSPEALDHVFFAAVPGWALYPMVALATVAAVTASQTVISGAFSVANTAVQLGFLPRLFIRQTSRAAKGQIYVPAINWVFMTGTLSLVVWFEQSSRLAAAYGVAVSTTMLVTTLFLYFVARHVWNWSRLRAVVLTVPFVTLNLLFFSSNLVKIPAGGWLPALIALFVFMIMDTWRQGRAALYRALDAEHLDLALFLSSIGIDPPVRVSGTAIFLTGTREGAPRALLHNMKHNRVLHEAVVLLTVATARVPFVAPTQRIEYETLGQGVSRMVLTYGFMERPHLPRDLREAAVPGFVYDEMDTTFFLGREAVLVGPGRGWFARLRGHLFALLSRNATNAAKFFRLPPNRVIEIGAQIEI